MRLYEGLKMDVTCGYLTVPENRTDPRSGTIRIAVAYLHSGSHDVLDDPIVELDGGPGQASLWSYAWWAGSPLLEHRDFIVFDQRGTGFSGPNLDCPEMVEPVWQILATNESPAVEGDLVRAAQEECRDRLEASGVDLDGYDTIEIAADVADLRVALGVDEWNLLGESYGSAVAQAVLRDHPEGVRSVVLDAVMPPDYALSGVDRGVDFLRSIELLADGCAAKPGCRARYGDVGALIADAAAVLDANPHEATIPDLDTGADRIVSFDGGDWYAAVFLAMYSPSTLTRIPSVAQSVIDGDLSVLDSYASILHDAVLRWPEAMTVSVNCADHQAITDPSALKPFLGGHPELAMLLQLDLYEVVCPAWGVASIPAPFNELLTDEEVDVPVLVMGGAFDPITPRDAPRRVADALGVDAVVMPNGSHMVSYTLCGRTIRDAFIDDPTVAPDLGCIADMPPLP